MKTRLFSTSIILINTALASWTQLRHDVILYGKQTYVPTGISFDPGYVEPVPNFYRRLSDLCDQTKEALGQYNLLPALYEDRLDNLSEQSSQFEGYARKILTGQSLTPNEQGDIQLSFSIPSRRAQPGWAWAMCSAIMKSPGPTMNA